jgi:phosphatidylinositol 4-kinase
MIDLDSPGFNINFESAPFKFTKEYLDIMGGLDTITFKNFEDSFLRGFLSLQKHVEELSAIVQVI